MEGFKESERSGLLGKVISILDNNIDMTEYTTNDWGNYKNSDKKRQLLKYFQEMSLLC